jgi:hypothetical protein
MRASQPSPRIDIQKRRGSNVMLASRALRHSTHPFRCFVYSAVSLLARQWNFSVELFIPTRRARARAAAFGLKRVVCAPHGFAGFDRSAAVSLPHRLRPVPADQFDLHPAV